MWGSGAEPVLRGPVPDLGAGTEALVCLWVEEESGRIGGRNCFGGARFEVGRP